MMKAWSCLFTLMLFQAAYGRFPTINKSSKPIKTITLSDPLILTDYIKQNKTAEARAASQVHYAGFQNVTSYSGYFTVDEIYNSNLYFWFFPAANDYENAPVVLWLQGGPGTPTFFGIFDENGPFIFNEDFSVSLRNYSWHKDHSVLYIDSPAGTGYSFTTGGFAQNQTKVGEDLYNALQQFFLVFPEFQNKPFFVAGESYGGKFVPAISYTIHQKNPTADLKINYQGGLIQNGWSDPEHMFVFSDLLYQLGFIDIPVREEFKVAEAEAVKLIQEGNFTAATQKFQHIILGGYDTMFYNATGFLNIYDYLDDTVGVSSYWQDFITQDEIRDALHVGSTNFTGQSMMVFNNLFDDITKSVAPWLSELLSHYRIIIYNGQLDVVVGYPVTANYIQHLNFSAAEEYKTAERKIWSVDDRVAGYVKKAGNLTEVMVRDASHVTSMKQPKAVYDLLYKFVRNIDLS